MRYTKGVNWVELEGCAELSMRALDALYNPGKTADTIAVTTEVVKDWHFIVKGAEVPKGDILGLTLLQWDWLRERIFEAARDEGLDPEV